MTQTHSLGKKAGLVLLGLQVLALEVTAEDNYALRSATLRHALEEPEDANAGLHLVFMLSMCSFSCDSSWDMFVPDEPLQLEQLVPPPQALLIVLANSAVSVNHCCVEGKGLMLTRKSAGTRLVAATPPMWLHRRRLGRSIHMVACSEYRNSCLLTILTSSTQTRYAQLEISTRWTFCST